MRPLLFIPSLSATDASSDGSGQAILGYQHPLETEKYENYRQKNTTQDSSIGNIECRIGLSAPAIVFSKKFDFFEYMVSLYVKISMEVKNDAVVLGEIYL